jgi:hypothetical protein
MKSWRLWAVAGAALCLATGLKIWIVLNGWAPFNADEAVVALMARHILQGARPVFFYGQAYMGSLDAFFVAAAFAWFGQHVWVIRFVQGILYLGFLTTTIWVGRRAFDSWSVGVLAAVLLAIPTVNVTLYTTVSLGGYGEALVIGNLILLAAMRLAEDLHSKTGAKLLWLWLGLGFLVGFGVWVFGLTLIFSLPTSVYLFLKTRHSARKVHDLLLPLALLAAGGLIGAAPWWGYALKYGFARLIGELSGGAIASVENSGWLTRVAGHLLGLSLLGSTVTLGLRPPWSASWLALPLAPFALFFWTATAGYTWRNLRSGYPRRAEQLLLVGVIATVLLGMICTPFGADPSGRYFLPLAAPMNLFAAAMILHLRHRWGNWAFAPAALLIVFHLWGTLQCVQRFPPGITTQYYAPAQIDHRRMPDLIEFLAQQGESRGYTNYWVAYPLAFLSQERMIFIPKLPYHLDFRYTPRDDRYAPYDEIVAQSERTAYICTHHPDLEAYLRGQFRQLGVTWKEKRIGDYQIFYRLSRPVRPEEIGLGLAVGE